MLNYLTTHKSYDWACRFLRDLRSSKEELTFTGKIPQLLPFSEVLSSLHQSKKRLIVLGVLGTIAELPKSKLNPLQF